MRIIKFILCCFFVTTACSAHKNPAVLFIGSSTIAYWQSTLATDFSNFHTLNEGVPGITYAYLFQHVHDYASKYPDVKNIVVYAGDNDIAIPFKTKESVAYDFSQTMIKLHSAFPAAHIFVISVKPCPIVLLRASTQTVKETNDLIQQNIRQLNHYAQACNESRYLFYVDIFRYMLTADGRPNSSLFCMPLGIHLNSRGYQIWRNVLLSVMSSV